MIGWLDLTAGASGDMLLGALVDAGAAVAVMQEAVDAIGVEPVHLSVSSTTRHGLAATKVDVKAPRSTVTRTWANIRAQLESAPLAEPIRRSALDAFSRLAGAEADVHRTTPEQVHFHEVGGLDAIADVVGVCAGLHALGLTELSAGPVSLGSGMSRGEHGFIPIPGPAVLQLLSDVAAPVWSGPAPYEMCTPTGAALLATTVTRWQEMPQMRVRTVGHGAGSRDVDEVANIVRLVLGEPVGQPDSGTAVLLESNLDDMDPRLWPDVLAALLTAGASDAWLTPILMKKGRPAYTLHALCAPTAEAAVRKQIFARTSTIGLRRIPVGKYALDREQASVRVQGEQIGVKLARDDGRVVNVSVEYEDVARAAQRLDLPVKEVLRAATAQAHRLFALGSADPPQR
ncbi:MAG: nickel pincer cofactor biosynthesis protein LarC [Geodermatophilaceae bacterium]|nr:nickel pincer cofactor biosynthesis protein LarC [Geodermatophilaceae bacterium]